MSVIFPPIETADENGLLAIGGNLAAETLLIAYSQGIFPWPVSELNPLTWFSPNPRGVLFFSELRINRSLKKALHKQNYHVRFNHNFKQVIEGCAYAKNRKEGEGTWITRPMLDAYVELHRLGHAFSVETYQDQELVGGLYGVNIGHFVSAESMFYFKSNASKIALVHLMEFLFQQGIDWIDIQMVTETLSQLGGQELERSYFIEMLKNAIPLSSIPFPS